MKSIDRIITLMQKSLLNVKLKKSTKLTDLFARIIPKTAQYTPKKQVNNVKKIFWAVPKSTPKYSWAGTIKINCKNGISYSGKM